MNTITLNVEIRVKPEGREELLEALRVLFNELSQEPTFAEAWLHTTEDEPDLIVVFEQWRETKASFVRDVLSKPYYKPYLSVFERVGIDRKVNWLVLRHSWRT